MVERRKLNKYPLHVSPIVHARGGHTRPGLSDDAAVFTNKDDSIENPDCLEWCSIIKVPWMSDKFLQDPDEALILNDFCRPDSGRFCGST